MGVTSQMRPLPRVPTGRSGAEVIGGEGVSQSERAGWPADLPGSEDADTPRGKDAWAGVCHPGLEVAISAGCCDGTAEAQDDVDQGEPGFAMSKPKLREGT